MFGRSRLLTAILLVPLEGTGVANGSWLLPGGARARGCRSRLPTATFDLTTIVDEASMTPRQSALRWGRWSHAGVWYSVTSCIDRREARLIPDPLCPLADPRPAEVVVRCVRWLHEQRRWTCKAYVIMPDHVHLIFALSEPTGLSVVMSSFGKFTAKELNRLQGKQGRVWQPGFLDHALRGDESYAAHLEYVRQNPVRKGYVHRAEDWPYTAVEPPW